MGGWGNEESFSAHTVLYDKMLFAQFPHFVSSLHTFSLSLSHLPSLSLEDRYTERNSLSLALSLSHCVK